MRDSMSNGGKSRSRGDVWRQLEKSCEDVRWKETVDGMIDIIRRRNEEVRESHTQRRLVAGKKSCDCVFCREPGAMCSRRYVEDLFESSQEVCEVALLVEVADGF